MRCVASRREPDPIDTRTSKDGHPSQTYAIAKGALNLLSTSLGGGVSLVGLPFAVKMVGLVWGAALLSISAIWAGYTIWILIRLSCHTTLSSYKGLALHTLGRQGEFTVILLIVVNAFGCGIAILDVFGDVVGKWRIMCIVAASTALTPIVALVKEIEKLAFLSLFVAIIVILFVSHVISDAAAEPRPSLPPAPGVPPASGLLSASSVIVLSYVRPAAPRTAAG